MANRSGSSTPMAPTLYVGRFHALRGNAFGDVSRPAFGQRQRPDVASCLVVIDAERLRLRYHAERGNDQKNLNEAMGRNRSDSWAGYQAQHLIPSELKSHPILKKVGVDLDDASNGLFLPATKAKPEGMVSGLPRHTGSHPNYTEAVRQSLNNMDKNLPVEQLQKQVYDLQIKLRNITESGMPVRNIDGAKTDVWLKWIKK